MKKLFFIIVTWFYVGILTAQTLFVVANPSVVCSGFSSTLTTFLGSSTSISYTWTASSNLIQFSNPNSQTTTVSGNLQGPYTVTCTAVSGTTSYQAQTQLIFGQNLIIHLSASQATTCIQDNQYKLSKPVTLLASGASSYVWFPYLNTPTIPYQLIIRPSSTTCYTVLGSNSVCSGSAVICVTVNPQFTIDVAPINPTICADEQISLVMRNPGPGYAGPLSACIFRWIDPQPISMSPANGYSSSVNVFPMSNSTYTAEIVDAAGCVSMPQKVNVNVQKCLGLKDESKDRFVFFQNSISGEFYLNGPISSLQSIDLIDLNGRLLLDIKEQFKKDDGPVPINIQAFPTGMYLLKLSGQDGKIFYTKISKQ